MVIECQDFCQMLDDVGNGSFMSKIDWKFLLTLNSLKFVWMQSVIETNLEGKCNHTTDNLAYSLLFRVTSKTTFISATLQKAWGDVADTKYKISWLFNCQNMKSCLPGINKVWRVLRALLAYLTSGTARNDLRLKRVYGSCHNFRTHFSPFTHHNGCVLLCTFSGPCRFDILHNELPAVCRQIVSN